MTVINTEQFIEAATQIFEKHLKGDVLEICIETMKNFYKGVSREFPIHSTESLRNALSWAFPFSSNAGNIPMSEWERLRTMDSQTDVDKFCEQYDSTFKYDIFDQLEKKLANEH